MAKTKYIESPEKLWEYFCSYREALKENPREIVEQRKSSVNFKFYSGADASELKEEIQEASNPIIRIPVQNPLTMEGFENWCSDNDIIEDLGDYFSNKKNQYSEYSTICSRIKRVIRQDQIEGGMVGIYNPSITARLNNLKETTEIEQRTTNFNYELSDLTEEEKQTLFDLSMKVKHED
ncbi:terminase small subunit [Chryseobacterium daeguense]|uniref:terminase small subunit n=1 Tax=Chryseobacterium daeguense TaxID=412438 RepID=UPI000403D9CE|nr:terminase small subunit [Chryseobacterium daeguense]